MPADEGASGRLDDRVLGALNDFPGRIAFNGLRRALGAHPESLARALRRLEREGLIERSSEGYRALTPETPGASSLVADLRPIAQVRIPSGSSPGSVLARLTGHWFGGLRWVGAVDRPSGRLLAWARRDGSGYVLLGIHDGSLRVYVPDEGGPGEVAESEDAAYEVLAHAVAALRTPADANAVTFLAARPTAGRSDWSGDN
jgi:hypothetical protein